MNIIFDISFIIGFSVALFLSFSMFVTYIFYMNRRQYKKIMFDIQRMETEADSFTKEVSFDKVYEDLDLDIENDYCVIPKYSMRKDPHR